MKCLNYSYHMQLLFENPVCSHHFKLRCFPSSDARQKIYDENIQIYPVHFRSTQNDSFGNLCIYGTVNQFHERFSVDVEGSAEIDNDAKLFDDMSNAALFKYETPLTKAGQEIREFHRGFEPINYMTKFERALYMMNKLYDEFWYKPGVTGVSTTAEEAFELRRGVCQDYAHILLALCRLERIPCKYIAGMIPGEGATHAWIAVYDAGIWIMIDPTHNKICNDTYIKISSGRDAKDCAINQGVFTGTGRQTQEIKAVVEVL